MRDRHQRYYTRTIPATGTLSRPRLSSDIHANVTVLPARRRNIASHRSTGTRPDDPPSHPHVTQTQYTRHVDPHPPSFLLLYIHYYLTSALARLRDVSVCIKTRANCLRRIRKSIDDTVSLQISQGRLARRRSKVLIVRYRTHGVAVFQTMPIWCGALHVRYEEAGRAPGAELGVGEDILYLGWI